MSMRFLGLACVTACIGALAVSAVTTPTAAADKSAIVRPAAVATCAVCHSFVASAAPGIGPNLFGVVGRNAGTSASGRYSPAMKASGIRWDKASLAGFIAAPRTVVPGTTMAYAGTDPKTARQIAEYLATLK